MASERERAEWRNLVARARLETALVPRCLWCEAKLEARTGPGKRSDYCSTKCRGVAQRRRTLLGRVA